MIDLRSDTVTQPTAEMLDAMRAAHLGDDSRDGDPTVGKLEALAAARTGKEAAMFVPSGTMGNLVALMAHTGRGGEVLLEESSHILKSEMGAIAQVAGLFHRTIRGEHPDVQSGSDRLAAEWPACHHVRADARRWYRPVAGLYGRRRDADAIYRLARRPDARQLLAGRPPGGLHIERIG